MKKISASLVLALLATIAALPAAAQARGALDPSFGEGGRVVREAPTKTIFGPTQVKQSPNGTIFTLYRGSLMAFGPDGGTDLSFGSEGVVPLLQRVPYEYGATLAVDSQGRPVVAGAVKVKEHGYAPPVAADRLLAVTRLLPDGSPDPSFNGGEVLFTDLGLPEAEAPPSAPASFRGGVSLQAAAVAVDRSGRILITGNRVAWYTTSKFGLIGQTEGIVARLAPDGSQDRSYATDGVARGFAPLGTARSALSPDGSLYVLSLLDAGREGAIGGVVRLSPRGFVSPSFGENGGVRVAYDEESGLSVDGKGRLTLASSALTPGGLQVTVIRYRRDGSPATGFGDRGRLRVVFAHTGAFSVAMAADRRGGMFLATTSILPKRPGNRTKGFLLAHVTRRGKLDRRFGRIKTGFGANSKVYVPGLSVDRQGQPLLASDIITPLLANRFGLALARYLPA
jgi:uncharacterized delta-60 repeat protein